MRDFSIRNARDEDWSAMLSIFEQGIATGMASFATSAPPWEEWNRNHLPFCRLVACEGETVLGWTALTPVSSRAAYAGVAEVSIYVRADARRRGMGRALLEQAVICSEKNNIWMLQSYIIQENAASLRLHESCGFRTVGYREKIARDNAGVWRNTVLMERRRAEPAG